MENLPEVRFAFGSFVSFYFVVGYFHPCFNLRGSKDNLFIQQYVCSEFRWYLRKDGGYDPACLHTVKVASVAGEVVNTHTQSGILSNVKTRQDGQMSRAFVCCFGRLGNPNHVCLNPGQVKPMI